MTHAIRSLICSREQSGWSHRWLGLDITLSLQWLCPQEIATPFLLVVTPIPAPSNIFWQGQITSNVFTQETINWETIVLKPTPFKFPSRIFLGLREDKIEIKINNRINKIEGRYDCTKPKDISSLLPGYDGVGKGWGCLQLRRQDPLSLDPATKTELFGAKKCSQEDVAGLGADSKWFTSGNGLDLVVVVVLLLL